ncbi:DUF6261 family protein [uncultured Sunxiuqinia sp.]|uniref:DUF6261 family protein n=1 Tax=uncultured Sunxiuqinia sp. TaxID=1573825 RepID=UPI002629A568|nr:DUF6261 family protein [uncultured Sunxiuqinia sp.]
MIPKVITVSRATEINDVGSRIVDAYNNTSLSSDAYLAGLMTELGNMLALLIAAIKRIKIASELEEQDELRDDAMRALYYLILGFLHHPDTAVKQAAERVFKVIEHYGLSMVDESYSSESSLIDSLLLDLEGPNLQADIAALSGCAELIAALKTAEDNFEATRLAYEEGKAAEATLQNATALKRKVAGVINKKLVIYLRAMVQVDTETYGSFGGTVAEIIASNNENVKRRSKTVKLVE